MVGTLAIRRCTCFFRDCSSKIFLASGIERRERADGAQEDAHRVRVVLEAFHQLLDVLVQHRVQRDLLRPLLQLVVARQLAENDQIRGLEVGGLLRQLLDGIAAVLEHPFIAIDVGDAAATRGRVHERRVVGDQAGILLAGLDLPQIRGANGAIRNGQLVLLAGAVIDDRQGLGHKRSGVSLGIGVGGGGGHGVAGDPVTVVGPAGQVFVAASLAAEWPPPLVHGTRAAQDAQQSIAHPTHFMSVATNDRNRQRQAASWPVRGGVGARFWSADRDPGMTGFRGSRLSPVCPPRDCPTWSRSE